MPQDDNRNVSTVHTGCLCCGESDAAHFSVRWKKADLVVLKCAQCGYCFVPPEHQRTVNYTDYKDAATSAAVRQGDEGIKRDLNRHRLELFKDHADSGRLLDVGTGWGYFVLMAREKGFDAQGIDMSTEMTRYAREVLRVPVVNSDFAHVETRDHFRVVTMWDVLEHIPDPGQFVQHAKKVLQANGILVIKVPRVDTIIARILGTRWWHFGSEHVNYFSRRALTKLLSQNGFQVREVISAIEPKNAFLYGVVPFLHDIGILRQRPSESENQKIFNAIVPEKPIKRRVLFGAYWTLIRILRTFRIGDEMIIIAEKST